MPSHTELERRRRANVERGALTDAQVGEANLELQRRREKEKLKATAPVTPVGPPDRSASTVAERGMARHRQDGQAAIKRSLENLATPRPQVGPTQSDKLSNKIVNEFTPAKIVEEITPTIEAQRLPQPQPGRTITILPTDSSATQRQIIFNDGAGGAETRTYQVPDAIAPAARDKWFNNVVTSLADRTKSTIVGAASPPSFLQKAGAFVGELGQAAKEQLPTIGAVIGPAIASRFGPAGRLAQKAIPSRAFTKKELSQSLTDTTQRTVGASALGSAGGESLRKGLSGEIADLQDLTKEGAFGSLFELAAGAVSKGLGNTLKFLRQRFLRPEEITPESKATEALLTELAQKEGKQTSGLSIGEKVMDPFTGKVRPQAGTLPETALQGFPFTSRIFEKPRLINEKLLNGEAQRMVEHATRKMERLGFSGPEALGMILISEAQGTQAGTRKIISKLYNELGKRTAGVSVNTARTQELLERFASSNRQGLDDVVDIIRGFDDAAEAFAPLAQGTSALDKIRAGTPLAFADAGNLRSQLLAFARKSTNDTATIRAQGIASKVAETLRVETEAAARQLSPEALSFFRAVKDRTKNAHANILTGTRKRGSLIETPAAIAIAAIDGIAKNLGRAPEIILKPGNTATVKAIKALAPNRWPVIADGLRAHLFIKASDISAPIDVGGAAVRIVRGKALRSELDRLGDPMLVEVFGAAQAQRLRQLADAMVIVESKASGIGGIAMALTAAGTIGGGIGSVFAGPGELFSIEGATTAAKGAGTAAAIIVLTPRLVAALVRSPDNIRRLEEGFKGGEKAIPMIARTLNRIAAQLSGPPIRQAVTPPPTQAGRPQKVF